MLEATSGQNRLPLSHIIQQTIQFGKYFECKWIWELQSLDMFFASESFKKIILKIM